MPRASKNAIAPRALNDGLRTRPTRERSSDCRALSMIRCVAGNVRVDRFDILGVTKSMFTFSQAKMFFAAVSPELDPSHASVSSPLRKCSNPVLFSLSIRSVTF